MINKKRLIQTFLELVQIDSPSGDEKEIARDVFKRLEKLGAAVQFDSYGNVVGKFEGTGEPFMLNTHLDTVEPGRGIKPVVKDDKITSDGTTILGGDPKAGVAAILEAIESLVEDKKDHVPLEVVFTLGEETGLFGALNLDYTKIKSKQGITVDGDNTIESICVSAPGFNRVDATIIGISAHAGVEPEKGVSAIKIAAEIITLLNVGRIDDETTANVGIITGGSARNAVPEKVTFEAEIRSRNLEKLEKHTAHFQEVFETVRKKYTEAVIELIIEREFNPYVFPEDHKVIQKAVKVLTQMGLTPKLHHSGGATDVNIFHTHGLDAVVVGTGDHKPHTTREYVIISQLLDVATFCEKIVQV